MLKRFTFGVRLWILIIALLGVSSGMIYELSSVWQRDQRLEARLTTTQIDRFQFASEIRRGLQNQNDYLLHYALVRDPRIWAQFDQACRDLSRWIDERDPNLNTNSPITTPKEREAFQHLNRSYDHYYAAAKAVYANALPAVVNTRQLAQLDAFNAQAQQMRDLVRELSSAHRAAEILFLSEATASLTSLRNVLIGSVILMMLLTAALGWVVYRDTVAPLRTKLVQSQHLLERQEKLATLGTLAAGIAHEIRNPLTSLKARLYTLEKHLVAAPAARKDTEIIGSEISRLERIVQDVLSFARPADSKLETLAADTILREVQGLMAPTLENRKVQLIVEFNPELHVLADSGHLKQVLINLVRNAADAIETTGTITLRALADRSRLNEQDMDTVVFEVIDTGKGIPAEVEKRLFDPFFSTKETGTGLGLPISARLVQKLGGTLRYQTRPGYGTTFGVVLPREINNTGHGVKHEAANP